MCSVFFFSQKVIYSFTIECILIVYKIKRNHRKMHFTSSKNIIKMSMNKVYVM